MLLLHLQILLSRMVHHHRLQNLLMLMIIMNPLQNLSQIPPPITLETIDAEDTTPESTAVDRSETDAE